MEIPNLAQIIKQAEALAPYIQRTPVWSLPARSFNSSMSADTRLVFKLELLQVTGTFKPRGALSVMLSLSKASRKKGVVAVSRGNHAIAVSYAASVLGCKATVIMPKGTPQVRIDACKKWGATIDIVGNFEAAFSKMNELAANEGLAPIHPYEGYYTSLGTATLGLEFKQQVPDLDTILVAIGGGGLAAGVGLAAKLINPKCRVIGVEPEHADTMYRSFKSGKPQKRGEKTTIADSLTVPSSMPYSFSLCKKYVDQIVLVSDEQIKEAMRLTFDQLKFAVEPAGACSLAVLLGSGAKKIPGKRIGVIICGSNIDAQGWAKLISKRSGEV